MHIYKTAVATSYVNFFYSPGQTRIFQTLLLCVSRNLLNDAIPDSVLNLPNFQLIRADRNAESTGNSHGDGTCFYINERWCTDVTVLKKTCCSDLETLFINCKPFYSPWEICSFILVSVYIPPQAHARSALQKLADLITETEQKHPDSVLIILGDFNKAISPVNSQNTGQHITCPPETVIYWITVYTAIKDAYHSVHRQLWDSLITVWFISHWPTGRRTEIR